MFFAGGPLPQGVDPSDTIQSFILRASLPPIAQRGSWRLFCKRSLLIKEQQLGREHLSTAIGLNNLAALYESQDKYEEAEPLMKQVLERNGYRVIDTDNGLDAASRAQYIHPDLVLVDLDVPLLYELVAARQIVKQAQLGVVPVVIITHEEVMDPYPLMEVGVRRNEYVTRLSDYEQLEHLLDYLLPVEPQAA